jgi:ABC-type spermidine/putrescine transport system permease subunit II
VVAVHASWRRYWPYLPLAIWALIVLFPIYWLVVTSFKPALAVSQGPTYLPWVDFQPSLHAWEGILFGAQAPAIRRAFVNSVIVGGASSLLALILGSFGAYGLARFRYRLGFIRNRDILVFIVSQRMMPPIVTALALFLMLHAVGLTDTRLGLILVYTAFNLPLAAWLMHNFFKGVRDLLRHADVRLGRRRGTAHALADRFVAEGGNFFDTSDKYNDGESERMLGSWLQDPATRRRGDREQDLLRRRSRPQRHGRHPQAHHEPDRPEPGASGDRLPRPLPDALLGRLDAARGDARGAPRPGSRLARCATSASRTTRRRS